MALKNPERNEDAYAFLDEASVHFFRALKEHYTRDTAVDVLNALQPILGKEWSGRVIFNMMADRYTYVAGLHMQADPLANRQKINAIKLFRELTGSGLTVAKHAVEQSEIVPISFELRSIPEGLTPTDWDIRIQTAIRDFKSFGYPAQIHQPSVHGTLLKYV